jgi:hypothetical protein
MYIEIIPNRTSPPTILLRESYRHGSQVRKRTLANLTHWPAEIVATLQRTLQGKRLVGLHDAFQILRSLPHGHVEAVLGTIKRLGVDTLMAAKRCRARDLVLAMIAARLLHPCAKLATTRLWHTTTLAEDLGVADADEHDLYAAMDWLLARQARVEKKLATRHLTDGAHALYDVTSSYYEGRQCALARFGYDRDGKKGRPIIGYGLLTDHAGRPIAVETYAGHPADPTTVPDQVRKLRQRFGLTHVVLVGDRGMLTQTQIDTRNRYPGLGWIAAWRAPAIRALVEEDRIAPSLFDQHPLAEIFSPDYPGERLVVCYNPLLAAERQRKREALLVATEQALQKIARAVARRTKTPLAPGELGPKVGTVLNRYKVGKHCTMTIADNAFTFARKEQAIQREALRDGLYVIRTSEPPERRSAADTVRSYNNLARVEQAFRCLKGLDLLVRPIRHWDEQRVRAHILVCMLAYYVEWHMRQALAPLLFEDEELAVVRWRRDPVAPAQPSSAVQKKKSVRLTSDGLPIHSFQTLLAALGTRCKNFCQSKATPGGFTFTQLTARTPLQQRASQLLGL